MASVHGQEIRSDMIQQKPRGVKEINRNKISFKKISAGNRRLSLGPLQSELAKSMIPIIKLAPSKMLYTWARGKLTNFFFSWTFRKGSPWKPVIFNVALEGKINNGHNNNGLPWQLSGKESVCQGRRGGFNPWVGKITQRKKWQLTPVFLPGKSHGQRSLVGYSSRGHKRFRHDLVTKQQQNNNNDDYHPEDL